MDVRLPGDARSGHVQFGREVTKLVVVLGDRCTVEGIGLDNIGAGLQIGQVNVLDNIGPGQGKQIVVALEVLVVVFEPLPAVIGLHQAERLDHGAHRPVQHQNPLLKGLLESCVCRRVRRHRSCIQFGLAGGMSPVAPIKKRHILTDGLPRGWSISDSARTFMHMFARIPE